MAVLSDCDASRSSLRSAHESHEVDIGFHTATVRIVRMDAVLDPPCGRLTNRTRLTSVFIRPQCESSEWMRCQILPAVGSRIALSGLTNRTRSLEMFNFPNHRGEFGIYQMQSYFR